MVVGRVLNTTYQARGLCLHRPKKCNSKKIWGTSLMFKNDYHGRGTSRKQILQIGLWDTDHGAGEKLSNDIKYNQLYRNWGEDFWWVREDG